MRHRPNLFLPILAGAALAKLLEAAEAKTADPLPKISEQSDLDAAEQIDRAERRRRARALKRKEPRHDR